MLSARQENARARVWRDEDDEHEHVRVAVKYFVRVHVRDAAGHTSWNTNERPSRASGEPCGPWRSAAFTCAQRHDNPPFSPRARPGRTASRRAALRRVPTQL